MSSPAATAEVPAEDFEKKQAFNEKANLELNSTDEDVVAVANAAQSHGIEAAFEAKVRLINHALVEIGMGRFQWEMFITTGFGWAADNLWLQGVALILPGIQSQFNPKRVAESTLFLYVGLIIGATFWGLSADILGRRFAFNATLIISGIFGIAAGGVQSFTAWCAMVACIGFGAGGNLPVDGGYFLEFLPQKRQWLLTLLSAWWAIGQVVGSLIVWPFYVQHSCPTNEAGTECMPGTFDQNNGWRYSMYTMGSIVLVMSIVRIFVLPVPESPKWLASQGRDEEAIEVLDKMAKKNKSSHSFTMEHVQAICSKYGVETSSKLTNKQIAQRSFSDLSLKHIKPLFATRKLAINSTLVIMIYGILGLAYPLFNGFLALYLTQVPGTTTNQAYSGYALQAFCGVPGSIIAAALVEWKVSGKWSFIAGRRGAMAVATILSGVFLFAFTTATTNSAVTGWNCATALTENMMYGCLYAYAPEIFPTPSRGSGDALASAASRVFGILAPIIKMFAHGNKAPVDVAAALFIFAGLLMMCLPLESAGDAAL